MLFFFCVILAILRNEVGWFDEEEHNSSLVAARLATDAADVKSAIAERISVILQNMTSLFTSFIVAFIVEWRVSLLILAAFPLLVLANMAQVKQLKTQNPFPKTPLMSISKHFKTQPTQKRLVFLFFIFFLPSPA